MNYIVNMTRGCRPRIMVWDVQPGEAERTLEVYRKSQPHEDVACMSGQEYDALLKARGHGDDE